jgi:hypothetical protein
MIASIINITEILAKFLVVLLIPFVKNVKEMEHVLNVKMNFISEVHVIHVINALMKNAILMENVKMKILIVKMMNIMEKSVIFNVMQQLKNNIA